MTNIKGVQSHNFLIILIHHVQRHHAPQRERVHKKGMRGEDFHITQLIQVNVFFRPQLFFFLKEVIKT